MSTFKKKKFVPICETEYEDPCLDEINEGPCDSEDPRVESETRTVFLWGHITERSTKPIVSSFLQLSKEDKHKPIYFVINTEGGLVYEAMAVYDIMKLIKTPIVTLGLGKIESAGTLLISAGYKGYRMIGKNARIMYHGVTGNNGGDICEQNNNFKEMERLQKQFNKLISIETGRSVKEVESLYLPRRLDRNLTPAQAKTFGFVDKIA